MTDVFAADGVLRQGLLELCIGRVCGNADIPRAARMGREGHEKQRYQNQGAHTMNIAGFTPTRRHHITVNRRPSCHQRQA